MYKYEYIIQIIGHEYISDDYIKIPFLEISV